MGTLTRIGTDASIWLGSHHLVGRSRAMHTSLPEPEISAEHAAIRWTSDGWRIRDLGSRNGTFVDGVRLAPAVPVALVEGATIWFGSEAHAYRLTSAAPPPATATCGDRIRRGDRTLLALPGEADPKIVVELDPESGWRLETDDETRDVRDGETVTLNGEAWTLRLPEPIAKTTDLASRTGRAAPRLGLRVSDDQEYAEVAVERDGETHALPPRAHHLVLLPLARARVEDRDRGVAPAEQGWIYTDMLARELGGRRNRVYLMLHRCRKELEALGVVEPLIEKRPPTRQMRLAWIEVTVRSL